MPERAAVRLERRERESSPSERAEREFRRALALLRDGRSGEAGEVLETALSLDRSHAAARQTLVALALERGQLDEAAKLLEDGLAIHPDNVAFAVALARIHVERRNPAGALAVLEPHRRTLLSNPQQAQFLAAVEQRLGRHAEAAEALRAALAANPQNGPGWAALGVSLEALGRPARRPSPTGARSRWVVSQRQPKNTRKLDFGRCAERREAATERRGFPARLVGGKAQGAIVHRNPLENKVSSPHPSCCGFELSSRVH
ncbi:MAG: tetratricopeptide repeat protein [Burkholderiales bacterium]|nr:tetratricopeptide repeat protein [Burkholderiales bacterium]